MKLHRGNFNSNKLFLEKTRLLRRTHTILEIGSGHGAMIKYLQNKGFNIIGLEINDRYIKSAKKNFGINLIKFNGKTYPFEKNKFDIAMSFDVLEHIPNTEFHLQEVKKILKNEGYYLLGTPNKITNILFEIIKEKSLTRWKKYHCSLCTYWGLKKIFQKNGFEIKFVYVPIINDFFKAKIKKYLGCFGLFLIKIFNPDKFPIFLKTNFYIIAKNKKV